MNDTISAIAQLVASVATLLTAVAVLRKVEGVQREVKTLNGLTIGNLADRAEGRRIEADVAPEDRTIEQARYADNLASDEADEQSAG